MPQERQLSDLAKIAEDASVSHQDRLVAQFVINALADFEGRGLLSVQPQVESVGSVSQLAGRAVEGLNPLASIVEAYQNQPHTPELVTQTHQAIWQARGELVGATYEVTPCSYTQEQLADLEAKGKRVGYLPAGLETQADRPKLGAMFPKMQSHSVQEGNSVTNDTNPSGWFDYEAAIDAPYTSTKEDQLMARLKKDERTILSLNQYIVAGQDSKLFTDKYLDEVRTWVRLGSRHDGRVVNASFNTDGYLNVVSNFGPGDRYSNLGARSSGVNKA